MRTLTSTLTAQYTVRAGQLQWNPEIPQSIGPMAPLAPHSVY